MIKFEIPLDPIVLRATAAMLEAVAAAEDRREDRRNAVITGGASAGRRIVQPPEMSAPYGVDATGEDKPVCAPGPTVTPDGLERVAPLPVGTEDLVNSVLPEGAEITEIERRPSGDLNVTAQLPGVVGSVAVVTPTVAPPTPPADTTTELDAAGYPWDERIHSGGKSKMKNGTWKRKRGVSPELVATVEFDCATGAPVPPPKPFADICRDAIADPMPPAADVNTFPALMEKVIKGGYSKEASDAACQTQGVQALVLVAPLFTSDPEGAPGIVAAIAAALDA